MDNSEEPKEPIMKFFNFSHLQGDVQEISRPFKEVARHIKKLPRCAERTVALRKLLESKDAAVRAYLDDKIEEED